MNRILKSFGKFGWTTLGIMAAVALVSIAAHRMQVSLSEADKRYEEKSYADALKGYEAAIKAGVVPALRKDEIGYRILVSLGKTQQWDRALTNSLDYIKTHRGTVWEPRALYWMGRLYLGVPHNGYQVGKKIYRGNNVPHTADSDAKPEAVNLSEQDSLNAHDALESAHVLYPHYRRKESTNAEEIQLDFDLARVLSESPDLALWASKQKWSKPADPEWNIAPGDEYSVKWPLPKKILSLYAQIPFLSESVPDGSHQSALALLAKAIWVRQYQNTMRSYANRWEDGKYITIPFPYQDIIPIDILKQLVKQYPNDPIRDQAEYTVAAWYQQANKPVEAVAEARRIIETRPQSKWAEDCRLLIEQLTSKQIQLSGLGPVLPGIGAKLNVYSHNVKTIHFKIYRVKLEDGLRNAEKLNRVDVPLTNFDENFNSIDQVAKTYGPPVATWDLTTKDDGTYQGLSETVKIPTMDVGEYVIEAGDGNIRSGTILLISDLSLVQKLSRDSALVFVTDAKSGSTLANTEIVAKQFWNENGKSHSTFTHARTDSDGLATIPLQLAEGRSYFRVQCAAHFANRYAITEEISDPGTIYDDDIYKIYSTTDRSVYRPLQRVFYRQLVMHRNKGDIQPVVNQKTHLTVYDPSDKIVFQKDAQTSEFGSVNGEFDLSSTSPLGEYTLNVSIPGHRNAYSTFGSNRFRVEEYKKPEFDVKVVPAADRVRTGEPTSATVQANYYFGGPVPNAKVTYRIYRNYWAQSFQFPRPFDFLYHYADNGNYNTYYRNGQVITQGEATTDDKGQAKIKFSTNPEANNGGGFGGYGGNGDTSFTIEADVQDASRRVISGEGSVKATKNDVAVFLNFPHGYATEGDRVDVEIQTLNPSDQPVSVSGTAKVFRISTRPDQKETLLYQEPLKTDKQGRGFFKWNSNTSGYLRFAFETHDTAEQPVAGSLPIWVAGPELSTGHFLFQNITLQVENPYYEQDQTAKVLLITPAPNTTVLITREANNEILDKQVVRIQGRTLELKIPLARRDVPNVFLSVITIHDGKMYGATQEIFVPPVKQFASISVHADKDKYQPGEKARLHLTAKDWQGKPLRTELSVAVTDAALNYIQKDYAPDVRSYYYGDRRTLSNQMSGSFGMSYSTFLTDSQQHGGYKTHEWLLPEGMGLLPDWPGAERQGYYYFYGYNNYRSYGRRGGLRSKGDSSFGDMSELSKQEAYASVPMDSMSADKPGGGAMFGGGGLGGGFGMNAHSDSAKKSKSGFKDSNFEDAQGLQGASLRTKFSDTAFWTPAVVTDKDGKASVEVTWPDNLTQWRAAALGTSTTAQVGSGETQVRTKKDVIVRLQAPRFFVERDTLLLTANVQNYLPHSAKIRVRLDLGNNTAEIVRHGDGLRQAGFTPSAYQNTVNTPEVWVDVPKDGEKRVDWLVHVTHEGSLKVRMTAQSNAASDSTELSFPVLVHGVERATAQGGVLREQREAKLAILLPKERKAKSSELVVQLNPSLAAIMLDALPYLNDYPYGCIEQTMSRFLPSVVVAQTLKDSGYDLEALGRRAKLLQERQVGGDGRKLVANSPYTYPKGRPGVMQTSHLGHYSPIFNSQTLRSMVEEGLNRIQVAQHSDGGWGWWVQDSSDPYMTAYVLYGLMTGKKAGYDVSTEMLYKGFRYLNARFLEDDNLHRMAYEARTLSMDPSYHDSIRPLVTGRIYTNRERLSGYSKALLAMALHSIGDKDKAMVLLRNMQTTAKIDQANGTANWNGIDGYWWHWYNNKVETNSAALQAYMQIQPDAPIAPMLVKWLVNNRRANSWYDTRATAMAVYALSDYARETKELAPDYTLTVDLGGRVRRTYTVNKENALLSDNQFIVPDEMLQTGKQTLTITKNGKGSCYYGAFTHYFSLEDPIASTGNEIFVKRKYYRLLAQTAHGQPQYKPVEYERPNPFLTGKYELLETGGVWAGYEDTQAGPRYDRVAIKSGDMVNSGDLLEVELQIESKNDYEYLAFEDLKPAGCEAVELRSGSNSGGGLYSNMELRDQKVAFFVNWLPQGTRTLSYRMIAEIPGAFHVLPTNAYAMYAPDIRAISDEMHLSIQDPPVRKVSRR